MSGVEKTSKFQSVFIARNPCNKSPFKSATIENASTKTESGVAVVRWRKATEQNNNDGRRMRMIKTKG